MRTRTNVHTQRNLISTLPEINFTRRFLNTGYLCSTVLRNKSEIYLEQCCQSCSNFSKKRRMATRHIGAHVFNL